MNKYILLVLLLPGIVLGECVDMGGDEELCISSSSPLLTITAPGNVIIYLDNEEVMIIRPHSFTVYASPEKLYKSVIDVLDKGKRE